MDDRFLVEKALEARKYAYAPYSHFRVGAALRTKSGRIFTGCNIENASFGATNCAERTALFKAISEGQKEFDTIAIVSDSDHLTFPCGICRQVLMEFGPGIRVIAANRKGEFSVFTLEEMLPCSFGAQDMKLNGKSSRDV